LADCFRKFQDGIYCILVFLYISEVQHGLEMALCSVLHQKELQRCL